MKSRGRLSPWITPRNSPAALQPRHLETDLRTGASAADQDAGAETSQPIYGKPKHGRPPTLIAHVPEARNTGVQRRIAQHGCPPGNGLSAKVRMVPIRQPADVLTIVSLMMTSRVAVAVPTAVAALAAAAEVEVGG